MDGHAWRFVDATVWGVNRSAPRQGRGKLFSNLLIVGMYLWLVWHDRPLCWACDRCRYGFLFRPRRLPSVSRFCKLFILTPRISGKIHPPRRAVSSKK